MNSAISKKRPGNPRLIGQLLSLFATASILLCACGGNDFPVYPDAKSADRDAGVNAVAGCGASAQIRIGRPGEQVEIDPQSYSSPDSLDTVKAWYKQNLSDWKEVGDVCGSGVSYVFPKTCNVTAGQCDKQLYVLANDSGGTWIVLFTR
jgi:hypothetical protein